MLKLRIVIIKNLETLKNEKYLQFIMSNKNKGIKLLC
jgi:hypothetical protein